MLCSATPRSMGPGSRAGRLQGPDRLSGGLGGVVARCRRIRGGRCPGTLPCEPCGHRTRGPCSSRKKYVDRLSLRTAAPPRAAEAGVPGRPRVYPADFRARAEPAALRYPREGPRTRRVAAVGVPYNLGATPPPQAGSARALRRMSPRSMRRSRHWRRSFARSGSSRARSASDRTHRDSMRSRWATPRRRCSGGEADPCGSPRS